MPIILDVEQGTTAWQMARIGLPTASCFDKIITEKSMKPSAQAFGYACRLLAEQKSGQPLDNATSGFMQRGSLQERNAVRLYEFQHDVETTAVGFVLRDDRRVGCSPDRFVGTDGLLEIKSPAMHTHVEYLLDDEGVGYRAQCQGQLWLCERDWIDTASYCPEWPTALVRQYRDEKFIAALAKAVDDFLVVVEMCKARLIAKGCVFPALETGERAA